MKNKRHSHSATFLDNKLYVIGGFCRFYAVHSVEVSHYSFTSSAYRVEFENEVKSNNKQLNMLLPLKRFIGKYCAAETDSKDYSVILMRHSN